MLTKAERLQMALDRNNMSKADLARKLQVKRGTVTNWCKGRYSPNDERAEQIATILNVNTAWLKGYNSPISRDNQYDRRGQEERIEQAIIASYRGSDETTKGIVRKILGIDI